MGILLGDHNLYELSYEQKFVRAAEKVVHPGIHICFNYAFQYTRIEPVMIVMGFHSVVSEFDKIKKFKSYLMFCKTFWWRFIMTLIFDVQ